MNVRSTRTYATLAGFIIVTLFGSVRAQELAPNQALSRGEEYFLVRVLEGLYTTIPRNLEAPEEFAAATVELRRKALRLKVRAETIEAHQSVIRAYGDFVTQLDQYTSFLANIGAIRLAARNEADKEGFQSGFNGGYVAGGTFATLNQYEDVSTKEAAIASLVVGGITYALDTWGKENERDEAERTAIATKARQIEDSYTTTIERTRQGFLGLATERGWQQEEIGWDVSPEHAETIIRLNSNGDLRALAQEFDRQRSQRPLDPTVRVYHAVYQAFVGPGDPDALDKVSDDCRATLELIPGDSTYDDHRFEATYLAAIFALASREAERKAGAPPTKSARSQKALALWEEVYGLQPSDPSGRLRLIRAQAYAADGDRLTALKEMMAIFDILGNQGDYQYALAWMLCLEGHWEESVVCLEQALRSDTVDLVNARTDPNFADLRTKRKDQFEKLTTPQWSSNVNNGIFLADVVFTNNSPFSLTNVKLVSNAPGWSPQLEATVIGSGETYTWSWISKIPPGLKVSLSLQSDQSP